MIYHQNIIKTPVYIENVIEKDGDDNGFIEESKLIKRK